MLARRGLLGAFLAAPAVMAFGASTRATGLIAETVVHEPIEADLVFKCTERYVGRWPPRPEIEEWLVAQETHSPRATLMLIAFWNAGAAT